MPVGFAVDVKMRPFISILSRLTPDRTRFDIANVVHVDKMAAT